jgi:hypothetical protein
MSPDNVTTRICMLTAITSAIAQKIGERYLAAQNENLPHPELAADLWLISLLDLIASAFETASWEGVIRETDLRECLTHIQDTLAVDAGMLRQLLQEQDTVTARAVPPDNTP